MDDNLLLSLISIMNRRLAALPVQTRPFTTEFGEIPRTVLVTGPRGSGKTTFILKKIDSSFLYFSADNPLIQGESLYSIVSYIFMHGFKGVVIDEVHYAKDWSLNLKALYDDFPDRKIWASDSCSLVLRKGYADLSRRFVSINVPFLSFREFIFLETGKLLAKVNPFDLQNSLPCIPDADLLNLFTQYKDHGTRPFYREGFYEERMLNILEKMLNSDIPFFVSNISDSHIRIMNAVVGTLAKSDIPRVHFNSLCTDWNIGTTKLYELLSVMEAVSAINILRFENSTKANSAGAKMFFSDPCLYQVLEGKTGNFREALTVTAAKSAGFSVFASRDETKGDLVLKHGDTKILVEVGGEKKSRKQADFVIRDNIDYPAQNVIPLWLLCMAW